MPYKKLKLKRAKFHSIWEYGWLMLPYKKLLTWLHDYFVILTLLYKLRPGFICIKLSSKADQLTLNGISSPSKNRGRVKPWPPGNCQ